MECNKEKALWAKRLAEKTMENKDFLRARKIAIQAQKLYPKLENISMLIMVCDVHCSAENKVHGTEMDWYGILKLEPTADDVLIVKQYRKFALFLHPEKNNFPGAADAFKLIGEAQSVLLDQGKRWLHDMKCKSAAVNGAPKQASRPSDVQRPPGLDNSSVNANKQFQKAPQTAQTGSNSNRPTFWAVCPFCSTRHQYCRDVLPRNLCCQSCGKAFTAHGVDGQGVAPQNGSSQSPFPKQTGVHNPAPSKVGPQSNSENSAPKVKVGGNTWSSKVAQGPKSSEVAETEPDIIEYLAPDFSDFDKNREEKCFAAGQIWAVYDTQDAMPRFYALIRKVLHPKFKLRITWLEPDPGDKDEIKWVEEDLPVSCGNFRLGASENTEDHLMFSHLVSWEKGSSWDTYKIYPRKGETWALFKSWDINWSSNPDNHRKYEYEFIEVLSDYANGTPISVAYLGKVRGYVCLFCQTKQEGVDSFEIEPTELFRFSYRIPSFQRTGKERKCIPIESFELDPACLPSNLTDEEDQMVQSDASGNTFENHMEEAYELPDPEFYNFDADKTIEKFEIGQVWALYSDEDGLPKYYGKIKKIDLLPVRKLHIMWLGVSSSPNGMIQWIDKKMLITCGRFKVRKLKSSEYLDTLSFSHQISVRVESRGTNEAYVILPRKGEVWALYKSWNSGLKCSDLEMCDYDIVEVVEENQSGISVLSLEKVDGFESVFRAQVKEQCPVTSKIPAKELLRFSHQIPAFRLTGERGGSLRGYLELDLAALPFHWFCKD